MGYIHKSKIEKEIFFCVQGRHFSISDLQKIIKTMQRKVKDLD